MDMPLVRPPQLGVSLDDNRRLHQDHNVLKRAVDKGNQESAASISSLHEKASKINLSVSDLHSDLKKLERMVTHNSASPQTSIVDMEVKLIRSLESRLLSSISDSVANAIDKKITGAFSQLESKLSDKYNAVASEENFALKVTDALAGLKEMIMQTDIARMPAASRSSQPLIQTPWMYPTQDNRCVLDPQRNVLCSTTSGLSGADAALGEAMIKSQSIAFKPSAAGRRTKCTMSFSMANAMQHVETPRPIPLGDTKEQKRVTEMIQKVDLQNTPPPGLTPEELEKFYDAAKDENDSLKPFPNNINPKTGEVNGPRGPEPTRFGDWERKGRVSDF
ncbi:hypothetical protein H4S08_002047 [Coemansia sp. RSA 1365]|nr:hypothetical protein H4S08_002047 [Coemansia sp. RSA 1365]